MHFASKYARPALAFPTSTFSSKGGPGGGPPCLCPRARTLWMYSAIARMSSVERSFAGIEGKPGVISWIRRVGPKRQAARIACACRRLGRSGAFLYPVEQHGDAIEAAWNLCRRNCDALAILGVARSGEAVSRLRNHIKPAKLVD